MRQVKELRRHLQQVFGWYKPRLDCLLTLLLALFQVRTVNLSELAVAFEGRAQCPSRYKRIWRFLSQVSIDQSRLARWLIRLMLGETEVSYLVMDRTVWYWGHRPINVLLVGLAWEGVAIPLCWRLLGQAGCSTANDQIQLLQRTLQAVGPERVAGVLLDREFVNQRLLQWLAQQDVPFYVRLKNNTQLKVHAKARTWRADRLFKQLQPKTQHAYAHYVQFHQIPRLRVAGSRSERGGLMIVLTNRQPQQAIPIYLRRWEIESLFQCLKSRGFRFEATHITRQKRIERLIAVLAIGVAWAHRVGEWRDQRRPIPWKRITKQHRPQYSYFSYGLELIRQALLNRKQKHQLKQCLQCLLVPPPGVQKKQQKEGIT
jgi:ribosomal protein L39E